MKKFIFLVSFLITIVFLSSCSPVCPENGSMKGYTFITIDSVEYIVVYGGHGPAGICPKVIK